MKKYANQKREMSSRRTRLNVHIGTLWSSGEKVAPVTGKKVKESCLYVYNREFATAINRNVML